MKRLPLLLVALTSFLLVVSGSALATARHATASPTSTSAPTITGTTSTGATLSATSGAWNGTTPISYAYQWQRCNSSGSNCGAISQATNQNYVVSNGDAGRTIRVQVTAANSDGSNQALSGATGTIVNTGAVPANTKQPDPSGKAEDGQKVTVDAGQWSGQKPITFSYQWQSCNAASVCTDIAGALSQSFTVTSSQVGSKLRATVTATNPAGKASTFSNLTAVVGAKAASPINTTLPLISGSTLVGHTVQASTGIWTGLTSGFGYQWSRCNTNGTSCASISGATGQSYGIGTVDVGNALRVSVTATNPTGSTSATSAASAITAPLVVRAGFSAVLRASQEVSRPNGMHSGAAGRFTARLTGRTLRWTLTFSHLTGRPIVAGLNRGLRGANGVAFKTLCRRCDLPSQGTMTLTAAQRDAMLRGGAYVNLHTNRNGLGEIRGQINRVS
jgi:CHRD domain